MMKKLWSDEAGFVTLEYLFGATILVIGMTVGLVVLKNSINAELTELGDAITSLSQTYSCSGQNFGTCASTGGSQATDTNGDSDVTTVAAGASTFDNQSTCP